MRRRRSPSCALRLSVGVAVILIAIGVIGQDAAAQAKKPQASTRAIVVVTEPDSSVWLDGVLYGRTSGEGELAISTVAPGRKVIRVRSDGFREALKPLLPTQSGKVSIPLTKTTDPAELAFQEAERQAVLDRAKAVEAYERAIRLRPSYVEPYIGLARVLSEMGEIDRVEKAIAAARKAKPGLAETSVIEGRILKSQGEDDSAIRSYKKAIKEAGGFQPEAYTGLGLIYKERAEEGGSTGDPAKEAANYAEAARNLSLAIKQLSGAPDSVILYQLLGLVYEQQKKPSQAIAVYEEFLRFFPDHSEADAFRSFIVQLKKEQ